MMNEPAAIQGYFYAFEPLKTAKSVRIVVTIPVEQANDALKALGGYPDAANPRMCAVALLDPKVAKAPISEPAGHAGAMNPPDPEPINHRLSQQAAMCCQDELFWRFLEKQFGPPGDAVIRDKDGAAEALRNLAKVDSRAEFDTDSGAAGAWNMIYSAFVKWKAA